MQSFKKPGPKALVVGCVAGAAVIGAVAIGGTAFADGPTPPSSSSATPPPAPSGAPSGAPSAAPKGGPSGAPKHAPKPPAGGPGGPAAHTPPKPGAPHRPHIGGEVTAVDGSTVTVKDPDGFTRTVHLQSGATVTKNGSKAGTSAIAKGQHIDATGTVAANGTTLNATAVSVGRPPAPPAR